MMKKDEILDGIQTTVFGKFIHSFEVVDSTNTVAKSFTPVEAPHGSLVISEEQTAGRGRLQRQWMAAKGENLLFSVILYPDIGMEKIQLLPFAGALAIADAIESTTGLSATLKWPNDVLINNKKVCGMLLETSSGNSSALKIILGIGVNVNQEEFPGELLFKATSLKKESGVPVKRTCLLQRILEELENRYTQLSRFPAEQLLHEWKMKALLFGKKITVLESEFSYDAIAIDLDGDGSLIIKTEDGRTKKIFAGDVGLAYT